MFCYVIRRCSRLQCFVMLLGGEVGCNVLFYYYVVK